MTLIGCGTVADNYVHYTAASAALPWYHVSIPKYATSALNPFDLESSLRQITFLFNGRVTESGRIKVERAHDDIYRSKIEEAAAEVTRQH